MPSRGRWCVLLVGGYPGQPRQQKPLDGLPRALGGKIPLLGIRIGRLSFLGLYLRCDGLSQECDSLDENEKSTRRLYLIYGQIFKGAFY